MFFNIANNRDNGLYIFPGTKTSGTNEWQSWTIPSSATYISMVAIGAGGDGGLGRAAASGTGKGGGGGGGSGGISKAIFRARVLPSTMFFNLTSTETTIALEPNTNNSLYWKILFALAGGAGGASTSTTGGTAGAAAVTATDITVGPPPFLASALTYHTVGGLAGGAGGAAGVAGTNVAFMGSGSYCLHGGAGGGGTSTTPTYFAGGSIASTADYFTGVSAGTLNAAGKGGDGGNGAWYWKPHLLGVGGGGGGAGSTLPGIGGNGAYGCGGGGGGSCVTANADAGGKGGPGLIIIKCF